MKRRSIFFLLTLLSSLTQNGLGATLEEGVELLHQGKLQEALTIIEDIAEKRPQDGNAQLTLGYILVRNREYERAGKVLRTALQTAGEHPAIHRLLAEIASQQGDFPRAFDEIEQSLALAPQDKETLVFREKLSKEWQIEEKMDKNFGGNFTVTFEGGGEELGAAALATLEEAYVDLGGHFQLWPHEKTEVILYGNRDFKSLTNAPDWSGGLYDGKIRIPIGGLQGMDENLRRILYHEYAHVLIRIIARDYVPLWLNEGLAQWAARQDTEALDQHLTKREKPLPFQRFEKSFAELTPAEVSLAYAQSLSLTQFLIDHIGEAQTIQILHTLAAGTSFQIAANEILAPWGGNFAGLEKAWRASLP